MRTKLWRDVPICIVIVAILAPAFWPAPACGCSKKAVGVENAKRLAYGLIQYQSDHDDRYPDRDGWRDSIEPYVLSKTVMADHSVPKGASGYAFNGSLSRAKMPKAPAEVPMVYDSVNPIRNASDLVTSLPNPGRHGGRDYMGYADGHVKGKPVGRQP